MKLLFFFRKYRLLPTLPALRSKVICYPGTAKRRKQKVNRSTFARLCGKGLAFIGSLWPGRFSYISRPDPMDSLLHQLTSRQGYWKLIS